MNQTEQRILLDRVAEDAKVRERNKMVPIKAIVTEHGSGDFDGMVRVRRFPHEPAGSPERPFYFVFGEVPAIGAEVFAMANFATGVVKGDLPAGGGGGYDTPEEVLAALLNVDTNTSGLNANFLQGVAGSGYAPSSHVGAGGSAHAVATTSAHGFHSSTDKTKIDSLSAQARGAFKASRTTDQLDLQSGINTKLILNSEVFDVSGFYVNDGTEGWCYKPTLAGYYEFHACVRLNPGSSGKIVTLNLFKNNALHEVMGQAFCSGTQPPSVAGVSSPILFNGSTDFVELMLFHDYGVNTPDVAGNSIDTWWAGRYMGSA